MMICAISWCVQCPLQWAFTIWPPPDAERLKMEEQAASLSGAVIICLSSVYHLFPSLPLHIPDHSSTVSTRSSVTISARQQHLLPKSAHLPTMLENRVDILGRATKSPHITNTYLQFTLHEQTELADIWVASRVHLKYMICCQSSSCHQRKHV